MSDLVLSQGCQSRRGVDNLIMRNNDSVATCTEYTTSDWLASSSAVCCSNAFGLHKMFPSDLSNEKNE